MLSSNFVSKKNASWTLPGGLLSASCNINQNFGAHVGLQQGTKKTTHFATWPSFWSNTTGNPKLSLITPNLSPKSEPKSMFLELILASDKGREKKTTHFKSAIACQAGGGTQSV